MKVHPLNRGPILLKGTLYFSGNLFKASGVWINRVFGKSVIKLENNDVLISLDPGLTKAFACLALSLGHTRYPYNSP